MSRPSRSRWLAFGAALGIVAALAWAGYRAVWPEAERGRAEREMAAGRFAAARDRLARLAAARPGRADLDYPLGVCEANLGRVGPALEAWARVAPGSPLGPRAALDAARLALDHGRLADAEAALDRLVRASGGAADEADRLGRALDLYSGRTDRLLRRIERRWRTAPDKPAQLRTHWQFDTQVLPLVAVGEALEKYGREAPDDDRVWLGRADLATRTGRFDEADRWLARCEAKRPGDPDLARARLFWALEAARPDLAAKALSRVPADRVAPADVPSIAARLAALRGDAAAERAALERRVALAPGDAGAWGRLADLASAAGPAGAEARANALKRKAEADRLSDEYRRLMGVAGGGGTPPVTELARAAEALGRRFEARGWWSLRALQAPDDPEPRAALARLGRDEPEPAPSGQTLADLIPAGAKAPPAATAAAPAPSGPVPGFHDAAETSGLRFVYDSDQTDLRRLPETMGGGVGLLDYDGDGWLDVYAVQGGKFPPDPRRAVPNGDRLFRNRRDGTFEDVTERAGLAAFPRGFGHGVTVGDYDNDGRADVFVTRWRGYALYRNKGDGTFEDATDRAGLGGPRGWPTSSAFADLDGDGDLDLYVCQYLKWDPETSPPCPDTADPKRHVYCVPRAFDAEPDRVFRNDGGKFVDVTDQAGFVDRDGRGLGVVVADVDGDGKPDVYVANDMTANYLYRNLGGFRFEEVGEASGCGSNTGGGYQAGMGLACGDLDGDGLPDLAVTNFYGESTTLYRNLGGGLFADRSAAAGLAAPTRYVLGFGLAFLDADNDGRLDVAQANGHVNDFRPAVPYAMPPQLLLGVAGGTLTDASPRAGACWAEPRVGRGLAAGDLDNDGRVDLLVLCQNAPLRYLHNDGPAAPGLTLRLEGTASNRDAVGAVVTVTTGGRTQKAWRVGGGSFLSASDGRVHAGLGGAAGPASVEVRWPSGKTDRYEGLTAGGHHLVEGDPKPRPLAGWR